MKHIFGLNYFVFCFIVLAVVLFFSKNIRDEGFFGMAPGVMDQLASTEPFFDNSGALVQLAADSVPDEEEGFGMSPGTLTQLQSTSVPSSSSCSGLPPMNTSMMNPMSTPLEKLIQDNLTKQGIMHMTEVPKKDPGFYALI